MSKKRSHPMQSRHKVSEVYEGIEAGLSQSRSAIYRTE